MIAYLRTRALPLEAGLKYLVLAAVSSAFLLFGIALIYASLGTMELSRMATTLPGSSFDRRLVFSGLAMLITGLGFKLAVVPFHLWTPDVYQGAPVPVTAYIATVSKGAVFAALLRYFLGARLVEIPSIFVLFSTIAVVSMIAGNLLALLQQNLKRILAYSSIAHLGYLLVAFLAGGSLAVVAVTFYLAAYFVTMLGAFGVVSILSNGDREPATLATYRGLFWRRPVLAAVFTAMLLSLAGIPLTAGFIAKFYVIAAGASSARWALVLVLAITSGIGLYYYLRVVVALYSQPERLVPAEPSLGPVPRLLLAVLTSLLLWFGVFPGALLRLIRDVVVS
jgi:NADH-quinone oxidoreductase subunit N